MVAVRYKLLLINPKNWRTPAPCQTNTTGLNCAGHMRGDETTLTLRGHRSTAHSPGARSLLNTRLGSPKINIEYTSRYTRGQEITPQMPRIIRRRDNLTMASKVREAQPPRFGHSCRITIRGKHLLSTQGKHFARPSPPALSIIPESPMEGKILRIAIHTVLIPCASGGPAPPEHGTGARSRFPRFPFSRETTFRRHF